MKKVEETVSSLLSEFPSNKGKIHGVKLDVGSLASVKEAVSELERLEKSKGVCVDTLVLNAGIAGPDTKEKSADGVETTFATNHLGHYLMEKLMRPRIMTNAKSAGLTPRIVIVSSGTHDPDNHTGMTPPIYAPQDWVNPKSYNSIRAYTNSKLANALHGSYLAATFTRASGHPTVAIYDPGFIGDTGLLRGTGFIQPALAAGVRGWLRLSSWRYGIPGQISTLERSGGFLAKLAVDNELVEETGAYYTIDEKWRTSKDAQQWTHQVELTELSDRLLRERGYSWAEV
ncbi:hypothetical protein HDU96_009577 [Phlyctochytrium bullatum]|nr:hypothetical protein HDU96_009577 [Phlyctochytrium bullatum]